MAEYTKSGGEGVGEKRIFERLPFRATMRYFDPQVNQWGLGHLADISANGFGMMTDRELPVQSPLEMWLPIKDRGESYYAKGNVVWSRMIERNQYRVGIVLEKINFVGMAQLMSAG